MHKPHSAKKIAIIGCAGSGKTTLSLHMQKFFNLPVIHLDKHYWKPNWQMPDFSEFYSIHYDLCQEPSWIMDGMYVRALLPRIMHADMIIFLDMPRYICIWRMLWRLARNRGKVSASGAHECPERFDFNFLKFVWHFNKRFRDKILFMIKDFESEKPVYILRSVQEVKSFLEQFED